MIERARVLAYKYHGNQEDPDGSLHIDHLYRVASKLSNEKEIVVAWLHDILEDTEIELRELDSNFGPEIVTAVVYLTRQPGQEYSEYLENLATLDLALKVKIADVMDNLERSLEDLNPRRRIKYFKALELLLSHVAV